MSYSIYFEYQGHNNHAQEVIEKLLNEYNIDYAHWGFQMDSNLTDIRYDSTDIKEADFIASLVSVIPNLHKYEFTENESQ